MWRPLKKTLATLVPALLLILFIAVMICFLNRWDSMVAITLIPVWAWAAFGMSLSLLSWICFRGPFAAVVFSIWMASGLILSEEPRSLIRELYLHPASRLPEELKTLRVVNVNAEGMEENLRVSTVLKPDIVIIQQAPESEALKQFARDLFGDAHVVITNRSNAFIARGETVNTLGETDSATLHVRILTPDGFLVDITNLDLAPYLPSPQLWKKEVWQRLTATRIENRRLLRHYLGENQLSSGRIGRIVSGGFGTPPGDDVFRPLESAQLTDAFGEAGTGWGNTYPADYPLVRLDQIWASANLRPLRAFTSVNRGSTHRIVVADFAVSLPEN